MKQRDDRTDEANEALAWSASAQEKMRHTARALPWPHQIAFMASCCERLAPNYRAFLVAHRQPTSGVLEQALETVWQVARGEAVPEAYLRERLQSLEDATPNGDKFRSIYVMQAWLAIGAIASTVRACLDGKASQLDNVVLIAMEAIYKYLSDLGTPYTISVSIEAAEVIDAWVCKSPFMVAEFEKQQADLRVLEAQERLTAEFCAEFRRAATTVAVDPIARGLVVETRFDGEV